jgi:hypothetical protein
MSYIIGLVIYGYIFFLLYSVLFIAPFLLLAWMIPVINPLILFVLLGVLFLSGTRAHLASQMYSTGEEGFVSSLLESGAQLWVMIRSTPLWAHVQKLFKRK